MRIRDLDARERGQIFRQQIDAVVDQQTSVDLRRLSGDPSFEQMLGLVANAGDDRVERLTDARFVAIERDLLLQLHQLLAPALCSLARSEEHTSELQSRFGISYAV